MLILIQKALKHTRNFFSSEEYIDQNKDDDIVPVFSMLTATKKKNTASAFFLLTFIMLIRVGKMYQSGFEALWLSQL